MLAGRLQHNNQNTYGVAEMVGTSNQVKNNSLIDDNWRFGGNTGGAAGISVVDDGLIFVLGLNVLSEYSSTGLFQRDVIRGGYLDGSSSFVVSRASAVPGPATYAMLLAGLGLIGVYCKPPQTEIRNKFHSFK